MVEVEGIGSPRTSASRVKAADLSGNAEQPVRKRRLKIDWDVIKVPTIWVLGTLLAIAIIGDQPYLGLAVAILGGIAVGLASVSAYDRARSSRGVQVKKEAGTPDVDRDGPSKR